MKTIVCYKSSMPYDKNISIDKFYAKIKISSDEIIISL